MEVLLIIIMCYSNLGACSTIVEPVARPDWPLCTTIEGRAKLAVKVARSQHVRLDGYNFLHVECREKHNV